MNENKIIFDKGQPQDFHLHVSIGDELSEDGLTHMEIDGIGNITAENIKTRTVKSRQEEKPQQYTGKCHRHDPARLLERASQLQWGLKFPSRPGIPDEAIVVWSLGKKEGEANVMKAWLRDAEKDPIMADLLTQLRDELSDLSDNQLYL